VFFLLGKPLALFNGNLKKERTNMTTINEKQFNATIKAINGNSEALAQAIHEAGLFAIAQANLHGNDGFAVRLIEAMGKKHDAQRVATWLMKFGKLGVKKGIMVYRKRLDITPENAQSFVDKADATPYWELTSQPQIKMTIDYLALLHSIVKRHSTAEESRKEGKEVTELHPEVLAQVKELLKKLGNPEEVKQVELPAPLLVSL
jgi:hypothetical protein